MAGWSPQNKSIDSLEASRKDSSTARAGDKLSAESDLTDQNNSKLASSQAKKVSASVLAQLPALAISSPDTAEVSQSTTLAKATIDSTAVQLHDAIFAKKKTLGLFKHDDADEEKLFRLIEPLSAADRLSLTQAYNKLFGDDKHSLVVDLSDKLGGIDELRAKAVFARQDGQTNDAGNLMIAIARAQSSHEKGEKEIREVFAGLNAKQIEELDANFNQQFGKGFRQTLKAANLTDQTSKALEWLTKGVDRRTPEDIKDYAHFAVKHKSLEMLGEALRGDFPEAKQARQELQNDLRFKKDLASAFQPRHHRSGVIGFVENVADVALGPLDDLVKGAITGNFNWAKIGISLLGPVGATGYHEEQELKHLFSTNRDAQRLLTAMDYLNSGHISLATIAITNTGSLWGLFDNKGAIKDAASHATKEEQQNYVVGRTLAQAQKTPGSAEETQALEFYTRVHKAFAAAGDRRETNIYEDQVLRGGSVISEIGELHSNGELFGRFGKGHSKESLLLTVENLSSLDWQALHDPESGKAFRSEIAQSLKSYVSDVDQVNILNLLDKKAAARTYEESQKIHRSVTEVFGENKGHDFLFFGKDYNDKHIVNAIVGISQEDIDRYRKLNSGSNSDAKPVFKTVVDKFVDNNLEGSEQLLAKSVLSQVEQTGKLPVLNETDKLLLAKINGANFEEIIRAAEVALKDPAGRARLSHPPLMGLDKIVSQIISDTISKKLFSPSYAAVAANNADAKAAVAAYLGPLLQEGHLPADLRIKLGFNKRALIEDLVIAPPAERAAVTSGLSKDERQVVEVGVKQIGQLTAVDRLRLFTIGAGGAYQEFQKQLSESDFNQINALKIEYAAKYGGSLNNDFLKKIDEKDRHTYANYLTPAFTDGRQDYFDNTHKLVRKTGVTADGSELALQRANELQGAALAQYQKTYQALPREQQQALDQYFGKSFERYKESKAKLAEIAVDAAITAAALYAAPFTGGQSLWATTAIIGTAASAGAVFRVAALSYIEGNDFKWSAGNVSEQLVRGGVTAAINFIGPELFGQVGEAFTSLAGDALSESGTLTAFSTQTAREAVEHELANSIIKNADAIKTGSNTSSVLADAERAFQQAGVPAEQSSRAAAQFERAVSKNFDQAWEHASARVLSRAQAEGINLFANQGVRGFAKQLGAKVIQNAAVGGAAGVVSELAVAPFSPNGVDWQRLKTAALTGIVIGGTLPVVIEGARVGISGLERALSHGQNYLVNLRRTGSGVEVFGQGIEIRRTNGEIVALTNEKGHSIDDIKEITNAPRLPNDAQHSSSIVHADGIVESRLPGSVTYQFPGHDTVKIEINDGNMLIADPLSGASRTVQVPKEILDIKPRLNEGKVVIFNFPEPRMVVGDLDIPDALGPAQMLVSEISIFPHDDIVGNEISYKLSNGDVIEVIAGHKGSYERYEDKQSFVFEGEKVYSLDEDGQRTLLPVHSESGTTASNSYTGRFEYAPGLSEVRSSNGDIKTTFPGGESWTYSSATGVEVRKAATGVEQVIDHNESVRQLAKNISDKYSAIGKVDLEPLLEQIPQADRPIARSILAKSATWIDDTKIRAALSLDLPEMDVLDDVDAYSLETGSSADILSYLTKKSSGRPWQIQGTDTLELALKSGLAPDQPIIVFGRADQLTADLQMRLTAGGAQVHFVDITAFDSSINFLDVASGKAADKLKVQVEAAKKLLKENSSLTVEQAVNSGSAAPSVAPLNVNIRRHDLAESLPPASRQISAQDVEESLHRNYPDALSREAAAHLLLDVARYHSFVDTARRVIDLHESLLFDLGSQAIEKEHGNATLAKSSLSQIMAAGRKAEEHVYYLTNVDSSGQNPGGSSGAYMTAVFAQANSIPSSRIITGSRLSELSSAQRESLSKGQLVIIDDTAYSGSQLKGIVDRYRDAYNVRVALLGAYVNADAALDGIPITTLAKHFGVSQATREFVPQENSLSKGLLAPQAAKELRTFSSVSSVDIYPYMFSDTTHGVIAAFAQRFLGLDV